MHLPTVKFRQAAPPKGDWGLIHTLLLVFLLGAVPAPAEVPPPAVSRASIEGVLSAPPITASSITKVTVTIVETGQVATVDEGGRYRFTAVPPGTYTLLASGEGFSRLRITEVPVSADQATEVGSRGMPILMADGKVQGAAESTESHRETDIVKLDRFAVSDAKPRAFTSRNVDLPRGENDAQPYRIFTAEEMEFSGSLTVEDFLKEKLTMDATERSAGQIYTGGIGTVSTINLRGLGADRTLVLINGRRSQGVDQQVSNIYGNQPDLNSLPQGAIDRIEVLPSGASAIYGAGAIGGVVNVVLKGNYTGGQLSLTYQNSFKTDIPTRVASLLYGFSLERGKTQVMLSATYRDVAPLYYQDQPEVAVRGINTILRNNPLFFYSTTTPPSLGSTTNIALNTAVVNGFRNVQNSTLTLKDGTPLNALITHVPAGFSPNTPTATLYSGLRANAGRYNLAIEPGNGIYGYRNQIGTSPTVEAYTASVTRQMTPWLELFAEFRYGNNEGIQSYNRISRAVVFTIPGNVPANPFRENISFHFPTYTDTPLRTLSKTKTASLGAVAQLPADWRGQVDLSWSQNFKGYSIYIDDTTWLNASLANGTLNPFVDTTLYPVDVTPYLGRNWYEGTATLKEISARASGPVFHLKSGRPMLTVGGGHRIQGYNNTAAHQRLPLTVASDADTVYLPQESTTSHAYAEIQVPVFRPENNLPWMKSLDLQFATRYEAFSVGTGTPSKVVRPSLIPPTVAYSAPTKNGQPFFETTRYGSMNYTAGVKYLPVASLTLRASFATAFIPPSAGQLLPNPLPGATLTTVNDPVSRTQYGVATIGGGNRGLTPQNTINWNGGAVWQPQGGPGRGLRLEVNYFYVKEKDVISTLNAETITNTPGLQSRVTRDPATNLIALVDTSLINLSYYETAGWDFAAAYRKTVAIGNLSLSASTTLTNYYSRQIGPKDPFLDYVGYPSLRGVPRLKSSGTFAWGKKGLTLGWTSRFISSYGVFDSPGSPYYSNPTVPPANRISNAQGGYSVESQLYHDIFGSYAFGRQGSGPGRQSRISRALLKGLTLKAGVRNLLDSAPPFDAYNNPYFYSYYGSPNLREYWISVRKDF